MTYSEKENYNPQETYSFIILDMTFVSYLITRHLYGDGIIVHGP